MSINQDDAQEQLENFYVERQPGHWKTVAACLTELRECVVVKGSELCATALGLLRDDDPIYLAIIKRANRLNNRVGKAGPREARELARAAIRLSAENPKCWKLMADFQRVSFSREVSSDLEFVAQAASERIGKTVESLRVQEPKLNQITEVDQLDRLNMYLKSLNTRVTNNAHRNELVSSLVSLCIAGEGDLWEAVGTIVGNHSVPVPLKTELNNLISCLSTYVEEGVVRLSALPAVSDDWVSADNWDTPLFKMLSEEALECKPHPLEEKSVPVKDLALQIALEIKQGRRGDEE